MISALVFCEKMDLRLLLFALVAVRVSQAAAGSGLYIMLRNQTTRYVDVWEIGNTGEASTRTFSSLALGRCSVNVEIVGYSTMDTKRHIFVGEYSHLARIRSQKNWVRDLANHTLHMEGCGLQAK